MILLATLAMEAALAPDILMLRAQLCEVERRADIAEAGAANAKAINADLLARNALLELQIEKLKRDRFGALSERSARLTDQMDRSTRLRRPSKNWKPMPMKPKHWQRPPQPKLQLLQSSPASGPGGNCLNIYRANALSFQHPRPAPAVAVMTCPSLVRMSPRHWK